MNGDSVDGTVATLVGGEAMATRLLVVTGDVLSPVGQGLVEEALVGLLTVVFFPLFYRLSRGMPRGLTPWMKPTTREPNH